MLKIIQAPDPVLATVCEACRTPDRTLDRLAAQMAELMYESAGCGIAAPQVGITRRLIVIDVDYDPGDPQTQDPLVLVNPEIVEADGPPTAAGEGCLSCPGINVTVVRKPWVRVRYFDTSGEQWEIEGDGLLGRCLQHEIDHLDGKTLFESCEPHLRAEALRAYGQARAQGARPGDTSIEIK